MKTKATELKTAIDKYVQSVRILLATVIFLPLLVLLGYYAPTILIALFCVPPCFVVMILLVRENEKIKSIVEWTDWLDSKMQDKEYLDGLLYIQYKQMAHALDPTEPHYYFTTSDLDYETYLREKHSNNEHIINSFR